VHDVGTILQADQAHSGCRRRLHEPPRVSVEDAGGEELPDLLARFRLVSRHGHARSPFAQWFSCIGHATPGDE